MTSAIYICGGGETPGPRDSCPNELHDWPLPAGYVDASEVAHSRLYRGWSNLRCTECGLFGWRAGKLKEADMRVPPHKARF